MANDVISGVGNLTPAYTPEASKSEAAASVKGREAVNAVEDISRSDNARADNDPRSAQVHEAELKSAVDKINEMMREGQRSLAFSVDEESSQVVVTVKNTETDEIVRQIPNEETLEFARHIESMMGLIFNDKA